MGIDNDTLELLERRLGEKVEKRVRGRLFAIYGAAATAFLSAFGYFGYDAVTDAKAAMETTVNEARSAMDATVAEFRKQAEELAREAVAPSVAEASQAAATAAATAKGATIRLGFIDDWMSERSLRLSNMEEDVSVTLGRIGKVISDVETQIGEMEAKLGDTEAQIAAQGERVNERAGVGNVAEIAMNLADLTRQVQALDDQLREVRSKAILTGLIYNTPASDRGLIDAVLDNSTAQTELPEARAEAPALVYFQFAGVARGEAEAISKQLAALGYEMPGEERLKSAAGLHEVRYFFETDFDRANRVASAVNGVLTDSGYEAQVTVEDYSTFKGAKPWPRTLELWLEPRRARASQ